MISKVRLKNWKSHLDSEFEFSQGVNGLIGIMGSGKSSVMDSISFALFGTFPHLNSRKIGLDDLIMKKPQQQKEAEVSLELKLNGSTYSVKRAIREGKGTTHAEIRENGKLIDVNPVGVTSYVEKILGIDYPLFSRAVYSEQNNIDYFLTIPKGKRMQHIDEMLKVDEFEKVREGIVKIKNSMLERRKEKVKIVREVEGENLEGKIEGVEKELEKVSADIESRKSEIEKIESDLKDSKEKIKNLEGKVEEGNKLEKELSGLESSIREISSREEVDIEGVEKEKNTFEREIERISGELKEKKNRLEEGRARIASLNTEIRVLNKDVEKIEKLGHRCPTCEGQITEQHKDSIIKEKRSQEEKIRKDVSSLALEIGSLGKEVDSLQEEQDKKKEILADLNSKVKQHQKILEELKRLEKCKVRKEEVKKEIKEIEKYLEGANLEDLREEYTKISSLYVGFKKEVEGLLKLKIKNQEIKGDLESRLETLKKYRLEIEKTDKTTENVDKFVKALTLTQDQLRKEFLKSVNNIMASIWTDLYPYEDIHEVRLALEDDYVLQLKTDRGWAYIETVSGGERSLTCLALRVAFSLAFTPNLKWLILDEPTHNLDKNAIKNFSSILRNKISSYINQVFLITHEESLAEDILGKMYRLERDKKNNQATVIVAI